MGFISQKQGRNLSILAATLSILVSVLALSGLLAILNAGQLTVVEQEVTIILVPDSNDELTPGTNVLLNVRISSPNYKLGKVRLQNLQPVANGSAWVIIYDQDITANNLNSFETQNSLRALANGSYAVKVTVWLVDFPSQPVVVAHNYYVGPKPSFIPGFQLWAFMIGFLALAYMKTRKDAR